MNIKKAYYYLFYKLYRLWNKAYHPFLSGNFRAEVTIIVLEIWLLLSIGIYYVISNVDEKGGVVFNSGHAWIRLESADGSIVTTMSIWGNTGEQEFWVDKELGDGYGAIYKSTEISVDQFNKIDAFNNISTNIDWTTSYTCAGYSAALWNHVTGGSLSSTAWGGYSTPGALAASMIATGRYSRTYSDDKKKSSK